MHTLHTVIALLFGAYTWTVSQLKMSLNKGWSQDGMSSVFEAVKVGLAPTLETIYARGDEDVGKLHGSRKTRNLYSMNRTDQPGAA